MASKIIGTESFRISDTLTIKCEMKRTRSGTRENATLYEDGMEIGAGTDFWSDRPWYRFTYENAIRNALENSKRYSREEIKVILDGLAAKDIERFEGLFKTVAMVAKMGEVLTEDKKERNDWKLRMMKAGLPELDVPADWDTLSEDEKTARLEKVIEAMRG